MTRKDYILIADALRIAEPEPKLGTMEQMERWSTWLFTCGRVADALASDNPRFDREHFLAVVRGERELTSRPPRS